MNIDYVFDFSDHAPQSWLPPRVFLAALLAALPLCVFLPTHTILKKACRPAR